VFLSYLLIVSFSHILRVCFIRVATYIKCVFLSTANGGGLLPGHVMFMQIDRGLMHMYYVCSMNLCLSMLVCFIGHGIWLNFN